MVGWFAFGSDCIHRFLSCGTFKKNIPILFLSFTILLFLIYLNVCQLLSLPLKTQVHTSSRKTGVITWPVKWEQHPKLSSLYPVPICSLLILTFPRRLGRGMSVKYGVVIVTQDHWLMLCNSLPLLHHVKWSEAISWKPCSSWWAAVSWVSV